MNATRLSLLVTISLLTSVVAAGQPDSRRRSVAAPVSPEAEVSTGSLPAAATHIVSVVRCRLVDTQRPDGTWGGPRMIAGQTRTFPVPGGPCANIPQALAYALTFTAIGPDSSTVNLRAWPTGGSPSIAPTVTLLRGTAANPADTTPRAAAAEASSTGSVDVSVDTGTHLLIDLTAYYNGGPSSGTVMTRWGNATAPTSTTLLYSGIAFGNHYTHNSRESLCMQGGDPGPSTGNTSDPLYPSTTAGSPPGIVDQRLIRCAVFLTPRPAVVIWGSWVGPAGWTELYRGFVMSGHYTHTGATSLRHCVDSVNFDSSITDTSTADLWYGTIFQQVPAGQPYTASTYAKCSVWMAP